MLCKIDKCYFLYLKVFIFFSFYREPILKKNNPQYHEENNYTANTTQTLKYPLLLNLLLFSMSFSPHIETGHGEQEFFNYYLQSPFNVPMTTKDKERYVFSSQPQEQILSAVVLKIRNITSPWVCIGLTARKNLDCLHGNKYF